MGAEPEPYTELDAVRYHALSWLAYQVIGDLVEAAVAHGRDLPASFQRDVVEILERGREAVHVVETRPPADWAQHVLGEIRGRALASAWAELVRRAAQRTDL